MSIKEFKPRRQTLGAASRMAIMHAKANKCIVRFEHEGIDILVSGEATEAEIERDFNRAKLVGDNSIGPAFIWTPEKQKEWFGACEAQRNKWDRDRRIRDHDKFLLNHFKHLHTMLDKYGGSLDTDDIEQVKNWIAKVVKKASGDEIT